jgi:syntaxin-binding protein 1
MSINFKLIRAQVESLEKVRQPFPEMDVIYFLAPCQESIDRLANDFKKKPCYANAHLFFLSKVSDEIMSQIQRHPALIARIKTFKEMNFDFIAAESFVFHLDEEVRCFRDIYSDALAPFAKRIAAKLATACFALNECPVIRCRKDSPMEAVAMLLVVCGVGHLRVFNPTIS